MCVDIARLTVQIAQAGEGGSVRILRRSVVVDKVSILKLPVLCLVDRAEKGFLLQLRQCVYGRRFVGRRDLPQHEWKGLI